jgi:hypothetical protein
VLCAPLYFTYSGGDVLGDSMAVNANRLRDLA